MRIRKPSGITMTVQVETLTGEYYFGVNTTSSSVEQHWFLTNQYHDMIRVNTTHHTQIISMPLGGLALSTFTELNQTGGTSLTLSPIPNNLKTIHFSTSGISGFLSGYAKATSGSTPPVIAVTSSQHIFVSHTINQYRYFQLWVRGLTSLTTDISSSFKVSYIFLPVHQQNSSTIFTMATLENVGSIETLEYGSMFDQNYLALTGYEAVQMNSQEFTTTNLNFSSMKKINFAYRSNNKMLTGVVT